MNFINNSTTIKMPKSIKHNWGAPSLKFEEKFGEKLNDDATYIIPIFEIIPMKLPI